MEAIEKPKGWLHDEQVEYRSDKRKMWKTFYGENYGFIVEQYGALEEVRQAFEQLYIYKNEPEIFWRGGGSKGCTLDIGIKIPSISDKPAFYRMSCKMEKVKLGREETNRLYFLSIGYANEETIWKNVTRLEGPSHTELIAKMYIHDNQDHIMRKAYDDGIIDRIFKIDSLFPARSLHEALIDYFAYFRPVFLKLAKKKEKAGPIVRDYILHAMTDAYRRNDQNAIERFKKIAEE